MENLTDKIKEILDTPDDRVNVDEAATVLLKINRNQILHRSIIRRDNVEKLKYELKKIYDFRMRDQAVAETAELEKQVAVIVKETLPEAGKIEASETKGMRADHEQLPDDIKAKFLENQNIFPRMRKLHEQLKLLGNARACDRYPYLKELTGLDKKLRANWDAYDTYIPADNNPPAGENPPDSEASTGTAPGTVTPAAGNESPEPPAATPDPEVPTGTAPETVNPTAGKESPEPPADARAISAARKYLSLNKRKLAELRKMEDQSKYLKLLDAMRKRLDLLIQSKAGISPEQLTELTNLGLDG